MISVSLESGFELRGRITHFEDFGDLCYYWYYSAPYFIRGSLYIGEVIYTVSQTMVKMNGMNSLAEFGRILL